MLLDATYGDVLSLYENIESKSDGRVLLAMNGDMNDGTGLSRVPPIELAKIVERMPFGALTIGNHELYRNENIEFMREKFVPYWNGSFVTSNVEPMGAKYYVYEDDVLVFGFLYEMKDHGDGVAVETAYEAMNETWFQQALETQGVRAVVALCHADAEDPLIEAVAAGIRRGLKTTSTPIVMLAGHSHRRKYVALPESNAAVIEAGRYMDTVGILTYDSTRGFEHSFVDGSKQSLRKCGGQTERGAALDREISAARDRMGLSRIVGCSDNTYFPPELVRLFLDSVVPKVLFGYNDSKRLVMDAVSFRATLHAGIVSVDDIYSIAPFQDSFWQVATNVTGASLAEDMEILSESLSEQFWYANVDLESTYDIYTIHFDVEDVLRKMNRGQERAIRAYPSKNATGLWFDYIGDQRCSLDDKILPTRQAQKDSRYLFGFGLAIVVSLWCAHRSKLWRKFKAPATHLKDTAAEMLLTSSNSHSSLGAGSNADHSSLESKAEQLVHGGDDDAAIMWEAETEDSHDE